MEAPDEADEYCPHCDNHFLREAVTKGGIVGLSGSGTDDLRVEKYAFPEMASPDCRVVRDDRVQGGGIQSTLEAIVDSSRRLG